MSRLVLWPRSLTGQLLLLVALALFVAQAINFALLLHERRGARFDQVVGPTVTRLADAAEREATGRPVPAEQGRVQHVSADPIPPAWRRRPEIASGISAGLAEAGIAVDAVDTGVGPIDPNQPWMRFLPRAQAARIRRNGLEIRIAVQQSGRGWLITHAPWPHSDRALIWGVAAQTMILYGVMLLPVLWLARRITQPLKVLAHAARAFTPGGEPPAPLAETGPSDLAAVTAAFNGLQLRVTAMLDEKDRMLGAIGHDLRTPLAALRVRIESVDEETDRARMADTVDEMSRTLDDILSLARAGRPSEPPTDTDLAALVDAVVEDFRDLGQDVTLADAPRLPLRLRPALMRRAVRNLIENAVKYAGGASVAVVSEAAGVAITVADRGPGIPPDRLGDVFDPFTRLEGSRNRETGGIGLGLALARAIVRDAGGEVVLANREGGGLLATIRLPAR